MPTIGSIINGGQGQVIARVPGGPAGTQSYLVRKLAGEQAAPTDASARPSGTTNAASNVPGQLSPEEKRIIAELQQRDRAVRNEEERHAATAGQYAGEPQYTFRRGPDGKMYAVEGKVPIRLGSAASGEDQEKALRRVQAAAVSVQSPSSGDFAAVAGAAASLAAQESGTTTSDVEKRREAERAYRDGQKNAEASEEAANLARELFGAIADQRI
ncbi:putative metalloprotease CJM1_0395 family protein [Dongia sp.]|uniref:putative metalloprotease CJM1_0395 family protein n=1 Tax=Dongia sp. TaxID=1977262 RepID=UPI0035B157D2